jgi:hypothetical protein
MKIGAYTSLCYCEIRVVDSEVLAASTAIALATASQVSSQSIFFCDADEVQQAPESDDAAILVGGGGGGGGGRVKVGDVVEFYPVDATVPSVYESVAGLALHPTIVPRSVLGSTIDGVSYIFIYCIDMTPY